MDPTLFAAFHDANAAERAFSSLLDLGVRPEDLSMVVNDFALGGPARTDSDDIAAYDAPSSAFASSAATEGRLEEEGSFTRESRIGAGIASSDSDDAASSVDELDDAQSAAEEETYPVDDHSYGSQEMHDVREGAVTGYFNTTEPDRAVIGAREMEDPLPSADVSAINARGVGRVIGDGILATAVTGAAMASSVGGRSAADLGDYLADSGVPKSEVSEILEPYTRGGAVLAATIRPGDSQGAQIEETLYLSGAKIVRTYNDLPEPNG